MNSNIQNNNIYSTAIMMKLGQDTDIKIDGNKTMKIYKEFCDKKGAVWFSTNSLHNGMGDKRRTEFIRAINNNETIEIFFIIGKGSNGTNDIEFRAEVLKIKTDRDGLYTPDKNLTPKEYINEKKKIWIKVKNLGEFTTLYIKDFIVESSKKGLDIALTTSQHHFGYIKRKDNILV